MKFKNLKGEHMSRGHVPGEFLSRGQMSGTKFFFFK